MSGSSRNFQSAGGAVNYTDIAAICVGQVFTKSEIPICLIRQGRRSRCYCDLQAG